MVDPAVDRVRAVHGPRVAPGGFRGTGATGHYQRDNALVLNEPAEVVLLLPVDELAMRLLIDLVGTNDRQEWSEYNYGVGANQNHTYRADPEAIEAIAEAFGWLHSRGLIARRLGQHDATAIFVTRAGRRALEDGLDKVRSGQQIQQGLHHLVEEEARPQFLLGKYELAVFASMKAVEVRVRALAGYGNGESGVSLMTHAFGTNGPLTDPGSTPGEQNGVRSLFAGAYAVLRNPAGHREIDYDDVAEAAEAVLTASLLMRILDRVQSRLES
jgi:uncharacterized protein (TIGR02391 family)